MHAKNARFYIRHIDTQPLRKWLWLESRQEVKCICLSRIPKPNPFFLRYTRLSPTPGDGYSSHKFCWTQSVRQLATKVGEGIDGGGGGRRGDLSRTNHCCNRPWRPRQQVTLISPSLVRLRCHSLLSCWYVW